MAYFDPLQLAETRKLIAGTEGEPARKRALFVPLSCLDLDGEYAEAQETVAREAFAQIVDDAGEAEAGPCPRDLLARVIKASREVTWAYGPGPGEDLIPIAARVPEAMTNVAWLMGDLLHWQARPSKRGASNARWEPQARDPLGWFFVDALNALENGLPLRFCLWCGSMFIPSRANGVYCRNACRASHTSAKRRAVLKAQEAGEPIPREVGPRVSVSASESLRAIFAFDAATAADSEPGDRS